MARTAVSTLYLSGISLLEIIRGALVTLCKDGYLILRFDVPGFGLTGPMPDATYITYPELGHVPMEENPVRTARDLRDNYNMYPSAPLLWSLPGPTTLNFKMDRKYQHRADHHHQAETGNIRERIGNHYRADDIADHQELQPHQHGAAHLASKILVKIRMRRAHISPDIAQTGAAHTQQDYGNPDHLNSVAYETDRTQETHTGHRRENLTLLWEKSRLRWQ
jgi:hypothetical protein